MATEPVTSILAKSRTQSAAVPYEISLVIQDKQFNANGSLFYPSVGNSAVYPVGVRLIAAWR